MYDSAFFLNIKRYQEHNSTFELVDHICKDTNIDKIFEFTKNYFMPQIKFLFPTSHKHDFDGLFNALQKDITIKLFDYASYYVMAKPISMSKLAEQFDRSRSTFKSYLETPTNQKELDFPCSLYINFILSHTDQILRNNKSDKRADPKSPFITEHGIPAILTAFHVYYKSDCLTPLNFSRPGQPTFSMENLGSLQSTIIKFIKDEAPSIRNAIKVFPIELTLYHIDSFWRTHYLSSLIKTYDVYLNKKTDIPIITDSDESIKVSIKCRNQDAVYEHECSDTKDNPYKKIYTHIPHNLYLDSVIRNFKYVDNCLNRFFQTNVFLLDLMLTYPFAEKTLHILVSVIQEFESVINYLITYTLVQTDPLQGISFFEKLNLFCKNSASTYLKEIYPIENNGFDCKSFNNEDLISEFYSRLIPVILKPLYNSPFETVKEMKNFFRIFYTAETTMGYKKSNDKISFLLPDSSSPQIASLLEGIGLQD